MLCVWGFGNSAKASVKNWARASLIWIGIGTVLMILFGVLLFSMLSNLMLYDYYAY